MRDYVLRVLERELRLDGLDEWFEDADRLEALTEIPADEAVDLIREGREERTGQILDAVRERARDED